MSNRICELEGEVQALRARVKRLQRAGKTIIAQREAWMARALAAEREAMELTAQLAGRRATRDSRYDALRRLIARELHPDHCTGGEIEKLVRASFSRASGLRSSSLRSERGKHPRGQVPTADDA